MRIYTRTGDQGETGLLGSLRVPKDHIRIAAYGEIDELNAQIGILRNAIADHGLDSLLERIQSLLFEVGTELATPPGGRRPEGAVQEADVAALEAEIDRIEGGLPPLRRFLLPCGSDAACRAHLARCVCRRAERAVVHLLRAEPSETVVLRFLNRLSDFLFVLARWANKRSNVAEPTWASRGTEDGKRDLGGPGQAS